NNRTHSFTLSGQTQGQNPITAMQGSMACSADWLVIPCVNNVGRVSNGPASSTCVDRLCGGTLSAEVGTTPTTVFSTVKPFRLAYHTNNVEAPNDSGNRGFCLNYVQQPCTNNLN
ncbi:Septin CDC11, partial [Frankliniella fusca]